MNRFAAAGVVIASIAVPSYSHAQEEPDTVKLRELVVTATRLETPIADAPGSITVLHGDALRSSGTRFLADALRAVPGVTLAQSAGPGALTSLFIRGGESDYVQVLIDGVQVNDPGGSFDWAHMRTEDIDRVEIVRGPASVLYGSDAVSGVIQIFTRTGGAPRVEAGMSGSRGDRHAGDTGSFDNHAYDASLTGRTAVPLGDDASVSYGLSGSRAGSTGLFALNSDYDHTSFSGRLSLDAARGELGLTTRLTVNEYHYPTNGAGLVVDRNQFSTGSSRSFGARAGYRISDAVDLRVLGTLHDTDAATRNPPDAEEIDRYWSTTDQRRTSLDAHVNVGVPLASVLTVGAEREWQQARTASESVSEFGTFTDSTDEQRHNTGWYAQLHGSPFSAVSLTVGARVDDNEKFGTFRTGRAALSWRPLEMLRLHGSFGTAFREPTFFENFATAYSRGNPDLEPEHTRSRDIGAEYVAFGGAVAVGATWFDQRFRNLIQYTFDTPAPDAPNYYNIGAARAHGIEVSASAAVRAFNATASYTRTATRVTDDGFGEDLAFQEGESLLRRPRHQAAVNASVQLGDAAAARFGARYVGEREDLDFTDPAQWSGIRTTLDAYTVVDAGMTYALVHGSRRSVDLSAGIRNLFDRAYQEIHNFPAPGRVIYLGLRAGLGL
ncbi:MAG TPA: TonB-dependent receptor [Longimicrobiales bacterium]|nr:TonB-dependent receptor [Longimicrobiales bacterium]